MAGNVDFAAVFDFESILEEAYKLFLCQKGFPTVVTPQSETKVQKERPRLEVVSKVTGASATGAAGQRIIDSTLGTPIPRDVAYNSELHITAVIDSQEAAKSAYRKYRALLRYLIPLSQFYLNGKSLTALTVNYIRDLGTVPMFKNEDGYWSFGIVFAVQFSINTQAFRTLQESVISQQLNT